MRQLRFFLLVFLPAVVQAQQDTIYIITEAENIPIARTALVEARDQIFRMQSRTKNMIKFGYQAGPLVSIRSKDFSPWPWGPFASDKLPGFQLHLGTEQKFSPAFSLNLLASVSAFADDSGLFGMLGARIEPRWYYDMGKKIRSGQQANNLSGNYLGLEFRSGFVEKGFYSEPRPNYFTNITLNWGMQRRLFAAGYFDFGLGLGVSHQSNDFLGKGANYFYTVPRVEFGLGMASPRQKKQIPGYCEALRCFMEERRMWKIDLLNALNIYSDYLGYSIRARPYIAFEQKIGASAFSVQPAISGTFKSTFVRNEFDEHYQTNVVQFKASVQLRWYSTLKRRIALGRSGNNLNGFYLGVSSGVDHVEAAQKNAALFLFNYTTQYHLAPIAGLQYRFLKNGFIDCYFGYGAVLSKWTDFNNRDFVPAEKDQEALARPIGGISVGFAF